jgi:Restriction Enzyme Adenine Methylase Associated
MAKNDLLVSFVEKISWRVMEEYPKIVKELIGHRSGVYALYHRDTLYYVGLAKKLMGRIKGHLKDRHRGAWDRFSVYLTKADSHIKQLESLLLRISRPTGNRVSGKIGKSSNLSRSLNRLMAEQDADRRAGLMGGNVARRRRAKAAVARGSMGLGGLVERAMPLRAHWKGRRFRATLRRDGYISFKGRKYESPSAAGARAVGHAVNGWAFWCYKVGPGRWVKLAHIRR